MTVNCMSRKVWASPNAASSVLMIPKLWYPNSVTQTRIEMDRIQCLVFGPENVISIESCRKPPFPISDNTWVLPAATWGKGTCMHSLSSFKSKFPFPSSWRCALMLREGQERAALVVLLTDEDAEAGSVPGHPEGYRQNHQGRCPQSRCSACPPSANI